MWMLGVVAAWIAIALVVCLGVAWCIRLADRAAVRRGTLANFTVDRADPDASTTPVDESPSVLAFASPPEIPVTRAPRASPQGRRP